MSNLQVFDQHEIRFVEHPEGKYGFGIVAADLATVLEIQRTNDLTSGLDEEYKATDNVRTLGGTQQMTVIWEPGVYQILATSRKPKAKPFQKWLFEQVLPSIRTTGKYESQPKPSVTQIELIAMMAQQMVEQERAIKEQGRILAQLVAEKEKAEEELSMLPLSEEKPQDIPDRGKINWIVRSHSQRTHAAYQATWSKLYLELYYRYKYDVKARCRNSGLKPLDQIEKDGMIEALHAIASEILC